MKLGELRKIISDIDTVYDNCDVTKGSCGYFCESFSQREFDEKVAPILGHKINFFLDLSYGFFKNI